MTTIPVPTPPVSTIIRQPLGPSAGGFGAPPPPTSTGPPAADTDSLRRSNTVGTHRTHQASASVSSTPAATSAFHGSRANPTSRFRSGSLSSGNNDPGLVRKASGRAVRKEEAVIESTEEGTTEMGSWGKGLSRQSSLPSRRGINPATFSPAEPVPQPPSQTSSIVQPTSSAAPRPPRPPRRISVNTSSAQGATPGPPTAHAPSHSLSSLSSLASLAMLSPPPAATVVETPAPATGVSRTQSLRAQAKSLVDAGGLGRSASMKAAGEHYRPMHSISSAMSPPTEPNTPHDPFTPPSPPPASSTAAFPPFHLPHDDLYAASPSDNNGADIKRHQSLTQGYGSSNRVRERLERSPAVLTLHQRDDLRRLGGHGRTISTDQPPTSPIGHSVWSPAQSGDDGWSRPNAQQLQDAFQAMNMGPISAGEGAALREPQPQQDLSRVPHLADEPSWVTNLVGHAERIPPQPVRTASAPNWNNRDMYGRPIDAGAMPPQWLAQQQSFLGQPFGQGVYQNLLPPGYGGVPGMRNGGQPGQSGTPSFSQAFSPYLAQPFVPAYPSPPGTAPLPSEDAAVIELAKQKGLNPATYDCRPAQARFFVIKSYTEEDVQKSLKHEIWSSTVLGNKRLDTAFRESGDKMPIFLFFSVNGSRHFCGVAQMLTAVDESQSSNVWSLDNKWKGIFKVKWIFVRDVPSAALRHIRLINTPEQKPITNSRDTQELHYEAGCEVLQIFLDYQTKSKTSLLQDFAYYERLSANRPPSAGGQRAPQSLNDPAQPYAGPQSLNLYPNAPLAHAGQQPIMMPPPLPAGLTMPPHAPHAAVPPVPPIPARFR